MSAPNASAASPHHPHDNLIFGAGAAVSTVFITYSWENRQTARR
jgi:hypothetical protein